VAKMVQFNIVVLPVDKLNFSITS